MDYIILIPQEPLEKGKRDVIQGLENVGGVCWYTQNRNVIISKFGFRQRNNGMEESGEKPHYWSWSHGNQEEELPFHLLDNLILFF